MSSSWPPHLKTWVADSMAKASPSTKAAVQAELKKILFDAHRNGTINTTDWSQVQLQSLQAPTLNSIAHFPSLAPAHSVAAAIIPPPAVVSSYRTPATVPAQTAASTSTTAKKKKKRKTTNETSPAASFPSPYHFVSDTAEAEALAKRAARFAKPAESDGLVARLEPRGVNEWFEDGDEIAYAGMKTGLKKMKGNNLGYNGAAAMEVDPNVIDWDHYTIKGTSTKLEKKYLRLTSEPSPADIRPLPVLRETLKLLKEKWRENHNYAYAVDQFKSVRQDLTVQRIKNDFTVEVYEVHARIALEAKDLGEYNQCQTMLRQLYELGIAGHPQEFLSYRVLYLLHTKNHSDMTALLTQLTPAEKADPGLQHALQVAASITSPNYIRFFRLFQTAPNMSGYIMDHFVERERMSALATMSKAYLSLTLPYLTQVLAFESDSEADKFLADHDIAIYTNASPPAPVIKSAWKPIKQTPRTPLHELVWDCKKAHAGCAKGMERYRVVDIKGQVD